MLPRSFLIESSSSKLLVTRTGIKAWTSLISCRIRLLTLMLLALKWQKFYTFELEYLWGQLANLDQILCVASLGEGKGCIMFWGRLDQNSGVHGNRKPPLTYIGEKGVSIFSPILFILADNEDMHKISDEFEFRPDRTTDYGVSCPWVSKKFPRLIMGKWCLHASLFIFYRIIIKVAGNQDNDKSSVEFDFGPNQTTHFGALILVLLALEWRKFHTFELEYLWSQLANFDQILCVSSLGWGKNCIRFWGRLTLAHWTQVSNHCSLGYLFKDSFCEWMISQALATLSQL